MTYSMGIHALMVSWYPRRRPSNPTSDVTMDLCPWRPHGVVEVDEEALKKSLDPHLATLDGVMDLLYDDDDLVRSLTCYGTHEHVLGMLKKPMKTWNP